MLSLGNAMRFICLVLLGACSMGRILADEPGDVLENSRLIWNTFLTKECTRGQSEQAIRKAMATKYRDIGMARANDEVYRLLFLVDDFHQIEFMFDNKSRLMLTPTIEPKGKWVRLPNGEVVVIPRPAEVVLKTKAEEAAIQYVANRTQHGRDILKAFCKRSAKKGTWDAVVTLDNLQVDSPNYVLEVTDDGQVKEVKPIVNRN